MLALRGLADVLERGEAGEHPAAGAVPEVDAPEPGPRDDFRGQYGAWYPANPEESNYRRQQRAYQRVHGRQGDAPRAALRR